MNVVEGQGVGDGESTLFTARRRAGAAERMRRVCSDVSNQDSWTVQNNRPARAGTDWIGTSAGTPFSTAPGRRAGGLFSWAPGRREGALPAEVLQHGFNTAATGAPGRREGAAGFPAPSVREIRFSRAPGRREPGQLTGRQARRKRVGVLAGNAAGLQACRRWITGAGKANMCLGFVFLRVWIGWSQVRGFDQAL